MRFALYIASRFPAPSSIPRNGPKTVGLNCYTTYITTEDNSHSLLLEETSRYGVTGLLLVNSRYEYRGCLTWASIKDANFEFTHFIGPYDFPYSNITAFLFAEVFGFHRYFIYRNRVEQYFFNKKRLARTERIDALRTIVERSLNNRGYNASVVGFLGEIHTNKFFHHPDKDLQLAYIRLLLDSLADSGDLIKDRDGMSYKVGSRALTTLAQYEEDNRRHHDSVKMQWILAGLTFALVVVGIIQILVSYLFRS
jgi:hypothetical protein